MADATPPVPRTWNPGEPVPPGRSRRRRLLVVLLALVLVTGAAVGLLYWFTPPREPTILPVWITAGPGNSGPVPWAEQDRAAFVEAGLLNHTADDTTANPNRDQIRLRFRALSRTKASQPVVVYLAAPASIDASGQVYLLPADPLGDHPRNRLPLAELLAYLREAPARHKLLVLQLTPPAEDPLHAPQPGELSAAVFRTLDESNDPARLCLVACGPGEVPHASADLGRSVFGYYLEAGLRGSADGWGGERDGRISVIELATFVRSRVSRWATANLRSPQNPVLVGMASDFSLATYSRERLIDRYPVPPASADADPTSPASSFPDWLRAAWDRHDAWLPLGHAGTAPRTLVLLRAALLAAERDLLAGRPANEVRQSLEARLAELDRLAATLATVPVPDPVPTLAALYPGYVIPDPAILRDLRDAVLRTDSPQPIAAADKPPLLPPEFDAFKTKPYAELALAAFRVLAEEGPPSAVRVKNLSRLLAAREPSPKFAEVLLIRRLADLADMLGSDWSPERAALALQAARDLEDAAARPGVMAWAKPALDDVYQLRADAEAVLFAPAFAPASLASERLRIAADAARQLRLFTERMQTATATRDEALRWIAGANGLVVDRGVNALSLATATCQLLESLEPPAEPLHRDDLAARAELWQQSERTVRDALAPLTRLFTSSELARLLTRARSGSASPELLAELNAVLATPFPPAADRAALWNARASITRRLNADAIHRDALDDQSYRSDLARPEPPNPRDVSTTPIRDSATVQQVTWSVQLLRLAGLAADANGLEREAVPANPGATAARLRRVWLEDAPAKLEGSTGPAAVRLGRVVPAVPATAFLDDPRRNPDTVTRRSQAVSLWGWHAARFVYEARDPVDPGPTDMGPRFATLAARACSEVGSRPAEPYLDVSAESVSLTAKQPRLDLGLGLRLLGTDATRDVTIGVFSPTAEWLQVSPVAGLTLGPIREQTIRVPLAVGDRPFLYPDRRGVLIETRIAAGRSYHRRTPVNLDAFVNRLDFVARANPEGESLREIDLRPNLAPLPYQLYLENPTTRPRKVVARLAGFGRETAEITIPAKGSTRLVFPPPPPVTPPIPAAAPMGKPTPPPEVVFEPIPRDELVLEVLDAADRTKPAERLSLPVRVRHPADYVKVDNDRGVTFRPTLDTVPNRLELWLVPGKVPVGPPVAVRATLPRERNPDVVKVRDATLSGELPADGRPLPLYAVSTAFAKPSGAYGLVTVAIDGCERVYTFAGPLPAVGGTVRLSPVLEPMIRVRARPAPPEGQEPPTNPVAPEPGQIEPYSEPVYVSGLQPLPVELEVDNAPEGATVELRVGTERTVGTSGKTEFTTDLAYPADPATNPLPAKERSSGLRFDPKGETLLLRGVLRDPRPMLPLEFIVGERIIEARLIGPDGKPILDSEGRPVVGRTLAVFDGVPPTGSRFLGLAPRVRKDVPLVVRATCDPTVSGIREVRFFIGPPGTTAKTPNIIKGVPIDEKESAWTAALPVAGLPERVVVGVQFTTRAGNSATVTETVELVDPAILNQPQPGTITGKVTDNGRPQGKLKVYLYDAAAKPLREATTDADGVYVFKDVPPGTYFVYAYHELTRRQDKKQVDLKPGETRTQDLQLFL